MATDKQLLLACVKSTIFGAAIPNGLFDAVSPEQWERVYTLSKLHDVSHIVAEFLSKGAYLKDDALMEKYKKQALKASYRAATQEHELERVKAAFEQHAIPFVVLKGATIQAYYPQEWMRTSCDMDLLVNPETHEQAQRILVEELGYSLGKKDLHDVSLHSPGNIHLELHYSVLEGLDNVDKVLADVWEYVMPSEGSCECRLTPEFFLCHITAHLCYHFINGGCGLRPVIDLKLLLEKMSYDREKLQNLLEKAGIQQFFESVAALADIWFGEREHDDTSRLLERYILQGGVYGSTKNRVLQQQSKGGKFKTLMNRIFVPYSILCIRFQKEIKPYQVPYYQVLRWFFLFQKGTAKKSLYEMKIHNTTDNADLETVETMMKSLGL